MLLLGVGLLVFAITCYVVVASLYPDDEVPIDGVDVFANSKNASTSTGDDRNIPAGGGDAPLLSYLKSKCCAIPVYPKRDGTTFTVLKSPSEFFTQLKSMIMAAETKISISALYVGDGELSKEFVRCLEVRVEEKIKEVRRAATLIITTGDSSSPIPIAVKPLQIEIVLDFNRMHHRANLRTLKRLLELGAVLHQDYEKLAVERPQMVSISEDGICCAATTTSVRLHLFQTPSQLNRFYPPKIFGRAREILGVQHTKLFSFDRRDVIATGANLSDDYFVTRMDRYAVVKRCPGLGAWYDEAIHALTLMSYEVTAEINESHLEAAVMDHRKEEGTAATTSTSSNVTPKMSPMTVMAASPTTTGPPGGFSLNGADPTSTATKSSSPTTSLISPVQSRKSTHKVTQLVIRHCPIGFDATDHTDAFVKASKVVWADFIRKVTNMPECGMVGGTAGNMAADGDGAADQKQPLTWIFPTLQFGRAGVYHDSIIIEEMVKGLASQDVQYRSKNHRKEEDAAAAGAATSTSVEPSATTAAFYFTSPYMNCYPELVRCMQQGTYTPTTTTTTTPVSEPPTAVPSTKSSFSFITASITTNGWKGQRGFAGMIPSIYLQLLRNFHFLMKQLGMSERVSVFEYSEVGMTFHSKGLWVCPTRSTTAAKVSGNDKRAPCPQEHPFLAAYGSTNYGHRSVHKDVESEILIYTMDPSLRAEMGAELERLLAHSTPVVEKTLFLGAEAPGRFRPVVAAVAHMGHRFL